MKKLLLTVTLFSLQLNCSDQLESELKLDAEGQVIPTDRQPQLITQRRNVQPLFRQLSVVEEKVSQEEKDKMLLDAILERNFDKMQEALSMGANPNASTSANIALNLATMIGRKDMVNLLLQKGADINEKDCLGRNALIWASIFVYEDMLEFLIENGADVNVQDLFEYTALMYFSERPNDDLDSIKILLDNGADVSFKANICKIKTKQGKTAIDLATNNNKKNLLKYGREYKDYAESVVNILQQKGNMLIDISLHIIINEYLDLNSWVECMYKNTEDNITNSSSKKNICTRLSSCGLY